MGTEAAQFPEKENINGIFVAVQDNRGVRNMSNVQPYVRLYFNPVLCPVQVLENVLHGFLHGVLYHYL
jgi:hypothetical protein